MDWNNRVMKNTRLLCCASPFVITVYNKVNLIPHGSHALRRSAVRLCRTKRRHPFECRMLAYRKDLLVGRQDIFDLPISGYLS
jgi:hypothetical protein